MEDKSFWKNFKLGEELSVPGTFIYNGLRRFHELRKLDHADEIFEVLYNLSVGLERLMKIAIVLLEHDDKTDQTAFEESLITHSHQDLLGRIRKSADVSILCGPHNDFLDVLTTFYKTLRYDRFTLQFVYILDRECDALLGLLSKHLGVKFEQRNSMLGVMNDDRYRKFIRNIVLKISGVLYEIISNRAGVLGLYTYELRSGSKAETVFLGKADIPTEHILWKELLVFFMNTKESSGYLRFLRGIDPLPFDPGLVDEYLDCFQSDSAKADVVGELETLYEDVANKSDRLNKMKAIGSPNVDFDDEDEDSDDDDIEPLDDDAGEHEKN